MKYECHPNLEVAHCSAMLPLLHRRKLATSRHAAPLLITKALEGSSLANEELFRLFAQFARSDLLIFFQSLFSVENSLVIAITR